MVMKSAEDGRRYNTAHLLDGAMDRSVLIQSPMSPQLVIVGGILRQILRKCASPRHHMVETLASDQTDQPFGDAVLPR